MVINVATNIVHATSCIEDWDGGAWLARNATEKIPIEIISAATALFEPFSKSIFEMRGIIFIYMCKNTLVWRAE